MLTLSWRFTWPFFKQKYVWQGTSTGFVRRGARHMHHQPPKLARVLALTISCRLTFLLLARQHHSLPLPDQQVLMISFYVLLPTISY